MVKINYFTNPEGIRKARVVTINDQGDVVETIMEPEQVIEDPLFGKALILDEAVEWQSSEEAMSFSDVDGGPVVGESTE